MRRMSLFACLGLAVLATLSFAVRAAVCAKRVVRARGIAVGAPKAFDNRTLNLMLERLNSQLAGITAIDQKALSQAIGAIQGSRIQETSRSLTVQGLPTPSIQTENDTSSSLTPPATSPTTSSTTKQTVSSASTTPTIPALPDLNTVPSALTNLQYGMSASDLLSEQVDLTYQIINLRMLLDRSLTDRLMSNLNTRLQTVVGFNVSIDPPRDAENAVAVVEITLKEDDACVTSESCSDGPSLVAVMPQEHTYNSVALSSKSNAFGGSAVAKMVTVGYTERHRGQTYYLFRDNDTVSFERQAEPESGEITFGWAFRPVLGRKSVAPGSRQLFAVVSLPKADTFVGDTTALSHGVAHFIVDIRAYWRKYDPGSLTSADDDEIRPWSRVGHILSLGTSLTYPPSGLTCVPGFTLSVPLTSYYLYSLSPKIASVTWRPVGTKEAVIAVKGQNFFQDTQVAIGDKLLSGGGDGLRLISDQAMDVTTDVSSLSGDAAILGRYGPAKPLEQSTSNYTKKHLSIERATFGAALGGYIQMSLRPRFDNDGCLELSDMDDMQLGNPIVFLSGTFVPGPYEFPLAGQNQKCVDIVARVPEALMPKLSGVVMLKFPFRHRYSASRRLYDPTGNFKLEALMANSDYILQKIDGAFVPGDRPNITVKNWRIIIADDPPLGLKDGCPQVWPKDANVFCLLAPHDNLARVSLGKGHKCVGANNLAPDKPCLPKILLLQEGVPDSKGNLSWGTYQVNVPSGQTGSEKASLDPNQSQTVNQHDEVWRSFTGVGLSDIGAVNALGFPLEINPAKDGKAVSVLIPKLVTKDAATIDLTFLDKQGTQIGTAQIIVKPRVSGGKQ